MQHTEYQYSCFETICIINDSLWLNINFRLSFSCIEKIFDSIVKRFVLCLTLCYIIMVQWVIGSIPHGDPIELFLIPASAPQLV